ncbi:MAG: ABC transporter permease [Treponema sp.]|nr:ABC transporter permease [Treponema sp.]
MPFYLALKNIFSRKSSLAIILFIAFAVSLLVVSNAFFDGTGQGIEKTFVNSFTGDVVIRPKVDFPLSLLGDETPATGNFSEIPQLVPYSNIFNFIKSFSGIESVVPQLSSPAVINTNGNHTVCVAFGVNSGEYLSIMSGIRIVEGKTFSENEKGIMLSESMIRNISESTGVTYKTGDTIQLLAGNGISYSIRAATLTGIYSYEIENDVLQKICLLSPEVLRELTGVVATSENNTAISENQNDLIQDDFDIDDLFGEELDMEQVVQSEIEENSVNTEILIISDATSWNYLVCKTNGNAKKIAKKLNRQFRKNGWEVETVTWRSAAGLSAMYLYWIHNIFTLGVIVLLGVGFIIVNNTLTVSALDRIPETGTLRAIGGKKNFIILQFMSETMILTILAGILGIFLGFIFNFLINKLNITLTNTYLVQIFGGNTLKTIITVSNIIKCLILSVILGIIGWIYPVKISMDVSPVQAMQRGM